MKSLFLILALIAGTLAIAAQKSGPGGIRFVPEKREWTAGSEQKIHIDGRATEGAKTAAYVWKSVSGRILSEGQLEKSAKGFDGIVKVPRFAVKGTPVLHLQIGKPAPADMWTFRSGKEFTLPKVKGLISDDAPPSLVSHNLTKIKGGTYALRTAVADSSGISQIMLIYKSGKKVELANGDCGSGKDSSLCAFFTKEDPIKNGARVVMIDAAGNRAVTSISANPKGSAK